MEDNLALESKRRELLLGAWMYGKKNGDLLGDQFQRSQDPDKRLPVIDVTRAMQGEEGRER